MLQARPVLFVAVLAVLACAGCSDAFKAGDADAGDDIEDDTSISDTTDPGDDTAVDTAEDVPDDTPTDTATDTGTDTVTDTVTDTGTDTVTDTGTDTVTDTGTDTGTDTVTDTVTDTSTDTITTDTSTDVSTDYITPDTSTDVITDVYTDPVTDFSAEVSDSWTDGVACFPGYTPVHEYLTFYDDYINMDAGTVERGVYSPPPSDPNWEFYLAYNSTTTWHARIFQNGGNGVEIAHLHGRTFSSVSSCDIAGVTFTTGLIDEPFDNTRTILIRTDLGIVYKVGNPSETSTTVSFDYARLTP